MNKQAGMRSKKGIKPWTIQNQQGAQTSTKAQQRTYLSFSTNYRNW